MKEPPEPFHSYEAVAQYLLGFDIFAGAPQEGRDYLAESIHRFVQTLELLPAAPSPEATLLELGANPYYLTLLIQKATAYHLASANYFGDQFGTAGEQVVTNEALGEQYRFRFDHFNVEKDRFPYEDATFDGVLFCEIIEHLTQDPTHALCEIHRVLKPDGFVIVTTPNVMSLPKLMALLWGRSNIYTPYSGYGVYGRHQREYALGELQDLVRGCGFEIVAALSANVYPAAWWRRAISFVLPNRRDHLFIRARKHGERYYYYPSSLYMSQHAIRRPVASTVVMGSNDIGHIELGWCAVDFLGGQPFRWTQKEGRLFLLRPPQADVLVVELSLGRDTKMPVEVTIGLLDAEDRLTLPLQDSEWHTLEMVLPPHPGVAETVAGVYIRPDSTFQPAAEGMNADDRELGVMVHRVAFEQRVFPGASTGVGAPQPAAQVEGPDVGDRR